jgi:tetratricopeptide (TPR) repeat protein
MTTNYLPTDYKDFSLKSKNNYRLSPDKDSLHRWSNELNDVNELLSKTNEAYNLLLRSLRRKKGFGLFFAIEPIPNRVDRIIQSLQQDLSQKRIATIEVDKNTKTLFDRVEQLYRENPFDILCIKGIENALYDYEDTQRLSGWTNEEIYTYSWKGVPPILSHLNQQRERFSSEFSSSSFVFFLPSFAIDYFIQRAPDFFDWRSGLFDFPTNDPKLSDVSSEITNSSFKPSLKLTEDEKIKRILDIKEILRRNSDSEECAKLHLEMALLYLSGDRYVKALDSLDSTIELQENNYERCNLWRLRGVTLFNLERYEEALASFDQAIAINPDQQVWVLRGRILGNLERYEEALDSFDKAIAISSDRQVLILRGRILGNLERYEEALDSFDKAIAISSDRQVLILRGRILENLERYEEALDSFDKAIAISSDRQVLALRGRILENLERRDEQSCKLLLYGSTLFDLKQYEEALVNFDKAISINHEDHVSWYLRGNTLDKLERYEEALDSFDKAININPDHCQSWQLCGIILGNLKQYEKALSSVKKSIHINPKSNLSYHILARIYHLQGKSDVAIERLNLVLNKKFIDDSITWNNLGFLYLIKNKLELANKCFNHSLQKESNQFHPIFNLALVHARRKRFNQIKSQAAQKRLKQIKQLIERSLNVCDDNTIQDKLYIALCEIILGKEREGLEKIETTLKDIQSGSIDHHLRCGILESTEILVDSGYFPGMDRALEIFQQALSKNVQQLQT